MVRKQRLLGKAVVSFQAIGDRTVWKLCLDDLGKGGLRSLAHTMCNLPFAAVYMTVVTRCDFRLCGVCTYVCYFNMRPNCTIHFTIRKPHMPFFQRSDRKRVIRY